MVVYTLFIQYLVILFQFWHSGGGSGGKLHREVPVGSSYDQFPFDGEFDPAQFHPINPKFSYATSFMNLVTRQDWSLLSLTIAAAALSTIAADMNLTN